MRNNWFLGASAACLAGAVVFFGSAGLAPAATHEQIIEACKEAARPPVIACIHKRRGAGGFETLREQCRQSVGVPFVKACVLREEQKEAVGKPAPPAPKIDETTPPSAEPALVRPSFVAPPRTTADIRAILDQEKPDPTKIAARRTAAEASPLGSAAAAETAQFYYDRGAARALLGRNKEALEDGLTALKAAKESGEFLRVSRVMQFVALRCSCVRRRG
jgi:hypothetical protein